MKTVQELINELVGDGLVPGVLDIRNYTNMFSKVCDVEQISADQWRYKNINADMLFSSHTSWVYFVVDGIEIKKIGETGLPLGIKDNNINDMIELQPIADSTSRFGRYRKGDGTDRFIRSSLAISAKAGTVSLWAHACTITKSTINVLGEQIEVNNTHHKDLETILIDRVVATIGTRPTLNKVRK